MRHLVLVALSIVALLACTPQTAQTPETAGEQGVWEEVKAMYDKAKEAGEQVPGDVYEWAKQDIQSIGDWEYKVVDLAVMDAQALETRLNELGAERWQCIWIQESGGKTRFIFKRSKRSYVQQIPMSQLLKMLPGGGSETE